MAEYVLACFFLTSLAVLFMWFIGDGDSFSKRVQQGALFVGIILACIIAFCLFSYGFVWAFYTVFKGGF